MEWIIFSLAFVFTSVGFFLLWSVPSLAKKPYLANEKVSVIIPARNEAKRITPLLKSLKKQSSLLYEWIVVDDHSTDDTAKIAEAYGAKVITAQPLPKGWFGKPWACYQGAKAATGNIFVFLDADTLLLPQGLEKILALYQTTKTPLSIQPFHLMTKFYEQFSLFFNLIVMMTTALFTPFGRKFKAQSFFGPCQVISQEDYWAVDGHAAARQAILEDIVLGEALQKSTGKAIRAYGGKGAIAFRMYPEGFNSLLEGWTKNFATGASLIPGWLLGLVSIWITGLFISFLSGIAPFMWANNVYLIGYFSTGLITWILARKVGNFSFLVVIFYPIFLVFFVWLFIRSSIRLKKNKQVIWKGRKLDL
jgi:4,4'-diaponeurosporenoate glycosyltransferase